MKKLTLYVTLGVTLLGTGCSSMREPVSVSVPVSVACVRAEDIPARPNLQADLAWANRPADVFERAKALLVDRLLLLSHTQRLEAILQACVGEAPK